MTLSARNQDIVQHLLEARASNRPWQTPFDDAPSADDAYAIQASVAAALGWFPAGPKAWKVGGKPEQISAAPLATPHINPTGNGLLATAGTGDVLAGFTGALFAAGKPAFQAAVDAVYLHGQAADDWPAGRALTAGALAAALTPAGHRSK